LPETSRTFILDEDQPHWLRDDGSPIEDNPNQIRSRSVRTPTIGCTPRVTTDFPADPEDPGSGETPGAASMGSTRSRYCCKALRPPVSRMCLTRRARTPGCPLSTHTPLMFAPRARAASTDLWPRAPRPLCRRFYGQDRVVQFRELGVKEAEPAQIVEDQACRHQVVAPRRQSADTELKRRHVIHATVEIRLKQA
jgi:hypothetical protein